MQICIYARQVKEGPAAGEFEERNTKLGKRSAGNWVFFRASMRRGRGDFLPFFHNPMSSHFSVADGRLSDFRMEAEEFDVPCPGGRVCHGPR